MNRQREAARTAALFLSFTAFFMTSPLTLWDAGLFAQISASRAVEVSVINGLDGNGHGAGDRRGAVVDDEGISARGACRGGNGGSGVYRGRLGLRGRADALAAGWRAGSLRDWACDGFWVGDADPGLVPCSLPVRAQALAAGHGHGVCDGHAR